MQGKDYEQLYYDALYENRKLKQRVNELENEIQDINNCRTKRNVDLQKYILLQFERRKMEKRKRNNNNVTCEQCIHCMYEQEGDMYCDITEDFELVYEEFCPTESYMWCKGHKFKKYNTKEGEVMKEKSNYTIKNLQKHQRILKT